MSHLFQRLAATATRPSTAPKLRPLSGSIYAPPRHFVAEDAGVNFGEDRADAITPPRPSPARGASRPLPSPRGEDPVAGSPKSAEATSFISATNRVDDLAPPESSSPAATPQAQDSVVIRPPRLNAASHLADQDPRAQIVHQPSRVTPVSPGPPTRQPLLPAAEQARAPLAAAQNPTSAPTAARMAPLLPARMPAAEASRAAIPQAPRGAASPASEGDEIHIHIGRIEVAAVSPPPARPAPAAASRKSLNLEEYLRRGNRRTG